MSRKTRQMKIIDFSHYIWQAISGNQARHCTTPLCLHALKTLISVIVFAMCPKSAQLNRF